MSDEFPFRSGHLAPSLLRLDMPGVKPAQREAWSDNPQHWQMFARKLRAESGPVDLLLGCGARRLRLNAWGGRLEWGRLVTLDNNPNHAPEVLHDLRQTVLPFEANTFDEIHAYEVLEHVGELGNAKQLLEQFADYWRCLKAGGVLCATVPHWRSIWAFGDPSHSRIINAGTLAFLSQQQYKDQIGKTPMSDFRNWYAADFEVADAFENDNTFGFVLRAVKPSRAEVRP